MLSHKCHFKVSHERVLKIIFSHEHQNKTIDSDSGSNTNDEFLYHSFII